MSPRVQGQMAHVCVKGRKKIKFSSLGNFRVYVLSHISKFASSTDHGEGNCKQTPDIWGCGLRHLPIFAIQALVARRIVKEVTVVEVLWKFHPENCFDLPAMNERKKNLDTHPQNLQLVPYLVLCASDR